MSDAPAPTPGSDAADKPAAPASNKLVPLFLILNSVLLAGVLGMVVLRPTQPAAPVKKEKALEGEKAAPGEEGAAAAAAAAVDLNKPGMGPKVALEDFVVHLRNTETDRYARFGFEVEVASDRDKEALGRQLSMVRDAFITHLSDLTLEELQGSAGLMQTKAHLMERLTALVPGVRLRALYITDFVVQ